ncbi:MAG: hypothetical protein ACTHNU_14580, partial [Gaiellales bacterium]
MRLLAAALAAVAVSAIVPASVGATASHHAAAAARFKQPSPCGSRAHKRPDIRHLIVIVMENHSFSQIIGPARYITALAHA